MKVVQFGTDIKSGELELKKRVSYVASDPIANSLAERYKRWLCKHEIFEPYYRPYMGQSLDGKSVAIWRTGGYGDILLITPIVEHLRRKYPTCKISVATSVRFRDVWKNNPHISRFNNSFSLPIRLDFVKQHDYSGIFEGTIENSLSKEQYCAIDVFAFTLGIFDMPLELKRPRYYLTSAEINAAKNRVRERTGLDITKDKYIAFQWKSSSKLRDYPYEKLVTAMHRLQQETGYKIVILTHENYRRMIEHEVPFAMKYVIGSDKPLNYINLAGITSYRESAAVLALSSGLVGIDSSLAHLAAALGVPSVTIYGPFRGEWRTLYNKNNITLQHPEVCDAAPCAYHTKPGDQDGVPHKLCTLNGQKPEFGREKFCRAMQAVSVDEVVESFMKLLEMQKSGILPAEREFKCKL